MLLVLLLTGLAACTVRSEVTVDVREGGTARLAVDVLVTTPETRVGLLVPTDLGLDATATREALAPQAAAAGLDPGAVTVTELLVDEAVGQRVVIDDAALAPLGRFLSSASIAGSTPLFEAFELRVEDGETMLAARLASTEALVAALRAVQEEETGAPEVEGLLPESGTAGRIEAELVLSVGVDGDVVAEDADRIDGRGRLVWEARPDVALPASARWRTASAAPLPVLVAAGLGVIGLVGAALLARRRRRAAHEGAAATDPGPPGNPEA